MFRLFFGTLTTCFCALHTALALLPPAVSGDYSGLVSAGAAVPPSNATNGFLSIRLASNSAFTGSVKIDGLTLPITGSLDSAGVAPVIPLARLNKPALLLTFQVDLSPTGTHKLTGTLDEQTATGSKAMSVIEADRAAFDGKTPATSTVAATYTCALFGGWTNPDFTPEGEGIGSVTVTKDGRLTLVGLLADGTALTCSAPMSAARTVSLFASLYANRGCFGALLALDEAQADSDLSSTASWWFRPFITGKVLPQGWPGGLSPQLVGARYAVPSGDSVLRDLDTAPTPNATLSFVDGGLIERINKPLNISKANAVAKFDSKDASLSVTLTAATGKVSGTFTQSDGTKAAFNAIVMQKGANRGAFGYFVGGAFAGGARLSYVKLPHPTIVISEFMAKNVSSIIDEDGAHSDWIELYNPGTTAVDLTNWCLTDSASNLNKWRFPATSLDAKQFLIVWASGKNRAVSGSPLHTSFSLSNGGEYLALVHADGVTIEQEFAPTFPALADDESYGVNFVGAPMLSKSAAVRYHVPRNESLGSAWTARTYNDSSWRSGKTGIGFGVTVPGMTVRQVAAAGSFGGVNSIATSDALMALPKGNANIASETTAIVAQLNLLGDGSDGHYESNLPLPNGTAEPYALVATGFVTIPTTGSYVFGLSSDDGGRIKIDGNAVMIDDTNHGPEDHLSAPVILTAGTHTIEVLMWEGGGGDEIELYAAAGTATVWDDSFKLVGGPGGLTVSTTPIGSSAVSPDVATNVQSLMKNINPSCYVRMPFTASDVNTLSALTLNMKYNDGFVAWLNGVEIVRRNVPTMLAFNSTATAARDISESLVAETIDLTPYLSSLVNGSNVLAIQAMNDVVSDNAFLVSPELFATGILRSSTAVKFGPIDGGLTATPGKINGRSQTVPVVDDTTFSVHRGFFTAPFTTAITTTTPGAQIRYTTDGSAPTATHGSIYARPLTIRRTTVLRAAAFKTGMKPTNVDTQSYFFLDDVIRQQPTGAAPGRGWQVGTVNGQVIDYGMDPAIVNSTDSTIGGAARVKEALAALPTISLVADLGNLFDPSIGIHSNPYGRGFDWERPCSMELIGDKGTKDGGFQINCGIRTRGGFSRSGDNPKHSFRFFFRSNYGKSKLSYPLFGSQGASSYDEIDLRTAQNYSWSFGGDGNNTFIREETTRELQRAMGQPGSRDRYCHVYINGVYWGIFDFDERKEASFSATYNGGNKADYDVVKCEQDQGYITGVTDGNLDAWRTLWDKTLAHAATPTNANYFAIQGKAADGITPTTDPVLLEVDNMIDYMLLTFWTGNLDGCTSAFLGESTANNWFCSRDRTGAHGGFRFFAHDFEHSFFNPDEDRTGPFNTGNEGNFANSNPMWIHHNLRPNAEYRMRWADRVQKHMFNNGALVGSSVSAIMQRRIAELDTPVIAESARWGDSKRATNEAPLTRLDWKNATNYIINDYLPVRGSRVLEQLRADGLYPSFDAPELSQFGGKIATGSEIIITGHGSTIYYTLDGADPRQIGGALNPSAQNYSSASSTETLVPLNQVWKYLGDGSNQGTAWRTAAFDDSSWLSGPGELGYGDGDEATVTPFIETAGQKNATTYFRSTFTISNAEQLTGASIRLKYDDAAIIYINGVEAVRTGNISSDPSFDQFASGATPDEGAFLDFTISPSLLIDGSNTIAAEVHQANGTSGDISFSMSLGVSRTATATPLLLSTAGTHRLQVRALSGSEWTALVDATFDVSALPDLRITPLANGTFNTGDNGKTFTLTVSNTGNAASSGLVTVTDVLPKGLTATSLTGSGWNIVGSTGSRVTATRSDALAVNANYPSLTLTVNVAGAAPASVITTASVIGGGEVNTANSTSSLTTPVTPVGNSVFSFDENRYNVNEQSGPVNVTILRSGSTVGSASVVLNTANGTAKAPADYDALTNLVIDFAEGESSKVIGINIANDTVKEGNETLMLKLSTPTNATLGTPSTTTANIIEADNVLPAISITAPAAKANVIAQGITITGKATDNKGITRVQLALNGGPFFDVPSSIARNGLSATFAAPVGLTAGANTVNARCYDTRGNLSPLATRSFIFTPLRALALTISPAKSGTVTIMPPASLTSLKVGTAYTLKPNAVAGFLFDHWITPNGDIDSPTLPFIMTEGLAITAVFIPNPFVASVAGDYNGLIRGVAGPAPSLSNNSFLNVKPSSTGAFTGTLKIDGNALALVGQFKNDGTCLLNVNRTNRTPLQLSLTLDLNPTGTHRLSVSVSDVGRDVTLLIANGECDRSYFDGRTQLATKASYKVRVPALPLSPLHSTGDGSGTVSIATNGVAICAMKLADNTSFTVSVPMSEAMKAPMFTTLYSTKQGCFLGTLSLQAPVGTLLSSDALWIKPHLGSAFGFNALLTIEKVP
jgi:uncharacterized repeat protein (TIGR01451 family)